MQANQEQDKKDPSKSVGRPFKKYSLFTCLDKIKHKIDCDHINEGEKVSQTTERKGANSFREPRESMLNTKYEIIWIFTPWIYRKYTLLLRHYAMVLRC